MRRREFFGKLVAAAPAVAAVAMLETGVQGAPRPVTMVGPYCSRCGNALWFDKPLHEDRRYDPSEMWTLGTCYCGTTHSPIRRYMEITQ